VATGEEEFKTLIRDRVIQMKLEIGGLRLFSQLDFPEQPSDTLLSTQAINGFVLGDGHQPAGRVDRQTISSPAVNGSGERLLERVLGEIEVPETADQRGEQSTPVILEDLLERPFH
jgi:hypothetical protein